MKPARLALTHNLVVGYGLNKHMEMYAPRKATEEEMSDFHTRDYVDFLKRCVVLPCPELLLLLWFTLKKSHPGQLYKLFQVPSEVQHWR